jgi:hypothetical protein
MGFPLPVEIAISLMAAEKFCLAIAEIQLCPTGPTP